MSRVKVASLWSWLACGSASFQLLSHKQRCLFSPSFFQVLVFNTNKAAGWMGQLKCCFPSQCFYSHFGVVALTQR